MKPKIILMNEPNQIQRPVTPASEGYGKMWDIFSRALHELPETSDKKHS